MKTLIIIHYDAKLEKYLNLVRYNFKVDKADYIFTYVTLVFKKFDNLYDFNLCY